MFYVSRVIESLHYGTGTCFRNSGSIPPIDISLTTPRLVPRCTWSVDHSTTIGSDHYPVHICIKGQRVAPQIQAKKRWNLKKIKWDSFNILIEEETVKGSENVSEFNHKLTGAILSRAERCQEATKAKRKATNELRRTRNDDYAAYKEERAAGTKIIKQQRQITRKSKVRRYQELQPQENYGPILT